MKPYRFAPPPDRTLPDQAEIVVIGGGVVGVTAALLLAEWGVPVVLCEKGWIAGEQSSRNWGWIRKQSRDTREMELMIEAESLWHRFASQSKTDFGLRRNGITYVAQTDEEMADHEAWFETVRAFQLDTQFLGSAETDALIGQDGRRFKGAIHTPSDQHAEPALAVPAVAELAEEAGAQIFEGTAVRTVEREAGRITAVVTEHGRIACSAVIFAGGAWSRPFLENMGLSLPQLAVRASAQRTETAPVITAGPVGIKGASIRPRLDGGFTVGRTIAARFDVIPAAFAHFRVFLPTLRKRWHILKLRFGSEFFGALGRHRWGPDQFSPMEGARMLDPTPDPALLSDTLAHAQDYFPQLRGIDSAERWGGMIDVSPDEVPFIGPVRGAEGMILASGLSGHGFGLGPGVGLLAAQLATGRDPVTDLAPFRLERF